MPSSPRHRWWQIAIAVTLTAAAAFLAWCLLAPRPERLSIDAHAGNVVALAFSPDGQLIISGGDTTVKIWNATTDVLQRTLDLRSPVRALALSPDGKQVAAAAEDGTVRVWRMDTGTESAALTLPTDSVACLAFSPDGQTLALAGEDKLIRLWKPPAREPYAKLKGHTGRIWALAFSPDGQLLASGAGDKTLRLWRLADVSTAATLKGHGNRVCTLTFVGAGGVLSCDRGGAIKTWDVKAMRESGTESFDVGRVLAAAFSSDGTSFGLGSEDGRVSFGRRKGAAATARSTCETSVHHGRAVLSLALSPDGKTAASGAEDGTVKIWDMPR